MIQTPRYHEVYKVQIGLNMLLSWLFKRLSTALLMLLLVLSITFFMMHLLPGGPFSEERKLPPQIEQQLNQNYGLDKPIHIQYLTYLSHAALGDFGPSYKYLSRSAAQVITPAIGISLRVGFLALLLGMGLGTVITLLSAQNRNWLKSLSQQVAMLGLSTPYFVLGSLLVLCFADGLGWLPSARLTTPWHFVLPVITMAINPAAYTILILTQSIETTAQQKYITIKNAFGIPGHVVLHQHILRNALLPLIAISGPMIANLLTGSFSVEVLFGIPGLGKYFVNAIFNRDYTVVMAITMVYCLILILANIGVELLMVLVDPRLKQASRFAAE